MYGGFRSADSLSSPPAHSHTRSAAAGKHGRRF